MHKGYTINYFINLFSNVAKRNMTVDEVAKVVSPRKGQNSQAFNALDRLLDYDLENVITGSDFGCDDFTRFGKTTRTRLLKALRTRKKYGYLF